VRLFAALLCAAALLAAAPEKKFKSREEYDLYEQIGKSIAANDFTKAAAGLDAFTRQFPDSDFTDDTKLLYVQTWAGANQPAKAVDAAGALIDKDLDAALRGPADVIKLLYTATVSIHKVTAPTPAQLAIGGKAAKSLLAYGKKPDGVAAADWETARSQLHAAARATLLHVVLLPGSQAMQKNDCQTAESLFARALGDYPDNAQAAWLLGTAELCLYKTIPEKASAALYAFARASAVDPVKGMVDPQWQKNTVEPYLEKIYLRYHGEDVEGLKQLKQAALASPLPPAGFRIKTLSEVLNDKQAEFETRNPQLALWMKIKAALSDSKGEEYFKSTLKDSAVPQLKGVLLEAKPVCRPTRLLVAIPLPDAAATTAEIALKLDKPLAGAPELQSEFHWEGVPTEFTASPFLLTMETETAKIAELKTAACSPAPVRKATPRKAAPKKAR
jgi:hypothetical protein